jgi:hypothetical protein
MRRYLLPLVAIAMLVAAGVAASATTVATTRSCTQAWSTFNVQIVGDRDWGWRLGAMEAFPDKKALLIVHSLGAKTFGGLNVYAWTSDSRSRFSQKCSPVEAKLKPPDVSALGPPVRVKDGWLFGRKFACLQKGRVLITVEQGSGKGRLTVRMQKSGETIAVGEVGAGGGWLRGSKTCDSREQ